MVQTCVRKVVLDAMKGSRKLQLIFGRWRYKWPQRFRNIQSHDDLGIGRCMGILILGRSYDFQQLQSEANKARICGTLHGLVVEPSAEIGSSDLLMAHRHWHWRLLPRAMPSLISRGGVIFKELCMYVYPAIKMQWLDVVSVEMFLLLLSGLRISISLVS